MILNVEVLGLGSFLFFSTLCIIKPQLFLPNEIVEIWSLELFNQYLRDYYYTLFLHAILLPCVCYLIVIKYVRNYWILKFWRYRRLNLPFDYCYSTAITTVWCNYSTEFLKQPVINEFFSTLL